MKRVFIVLWCLIASAACGQTIDLIAVDFPPTTSLMTHWAGTATDDLWAAAPLHHWDGKEWTPIDLTLDSGDAIEGTTLAAAGRRKLWVPTKHGKLYRVSAAGEIEDFSEIVGGREGTARFTIATRGDLTLIALHFLGGTGPSEVYRLVERRLEPLPPFPSAATRNEVTSFRIVSDKEIWATAAAYEGTIPMRPRERRELATSDYLFNGEEWIALSSGLIHATTEFPYVDVGGLGAVSDLWPSDDVWLDCGPRALHFDGAVSRPLAIALPATDHCIFLHTGDRPAILYRTASSKGGSGEPINYACDVYGTCSLLDVPWTVVVAHRIAEWDGEAWVNDRPFLESGECAGAACAHFNTTISGIVAILEDGSGVFLANEADRSSAKLHLFRP